MMNAKMFEPEQCLSNVVLQRVYIPKGGNDILRIETVDDDITFYLSIEPRDNWADTELIEGLEDLQGLVGQKLVKFEVVENEEDNFDDSEENYSEEALKTWTYYKFQGEKDCATLHFYSVSNGYYATSVNIVLDKVKVGNEKTQIEKNANDFVV
nr:MAG TPA: hypothetical protein [Caudoviricetes sp.]